MNKSNLVAGAVLFSVISVTAPAIAEPQGGQVRSGTATIQQAQGTTTIQQLTDKAIIDWQRFNVNPNELVRFIQPSEMAVILNRVVGKDPSAIMGKLQANGQLFLVNPNGILFGPSSRVDVGSLVATTLSISNEDFLNGNYRFVQDPGFDLASVVNQGEIHVTDGGYVILTAPLVSNEGLIVANLGKVSLGAGQEMTVNLDGRNLVNFQLGTAPSDGGTVVLTPEAVGNVLGQVVNQGELVGAAQIVEENGSVRLVGGEGTLVQSGTIRSGSVQLDATGTTDLTAASRTQGSDVRVLGQHVLVQGAVNGSQILVGGETRGQGSTHRAATTRLTDGAALQADPGGTIVVWSDQRTDVAGSLRAQGGLIETSSQRDLNFAGQVDAGEGGTWLIDPANLTIVAGAAGTNQISASSINTSLNAGTNVTIDAQAAAGTAAGNITQNAGASILKSAGGNATLTLHAGTTSGSITLNDNVTSTTGMLALVLEAGATSGNVTLNGNITTNGGTLATSGGGTLTANNSATIQANAGSIVASHGGTIAVGNLSAANITLTSTTGAINENGNDANADLTGSTITLNSSTGVGAAAALEVNATSLTATASGAGNINVADTAGGVTANCTTNNGTITLSATGGDLVANSVNAGGTGKNVALSTATSGNVLLGDVQAAGDTITVTSVSSIQEAGADVTADAQAGTLSFTAAGGIGSTGSVEVDGTSLTASASAGNIDLTDTTGGIVITSANTTSGDITLTSQGGNLTATSVTAGGAGRNVNLVSSNSTGTVLVGDVNATSGTINATSGFSIEESGSDAGSDLNASTINLTASNGIGMLNQIELNATTQLNASASLGSISLRDTAGGLNVGAASSVNGDVSLSSAAALSVGSASGQNVSLASSGSGNVQINSASAVNAVTVSSAGTLTELGSDAGAEITAANANLSAATSIGASGSPFLVDVAGLSGTTTGTGGIYLADNNGGLQVGTLTSNNGEIVLNVTGGDLFAGTVTAGGNARNITLSGAQNVFVDNVSAVSDDIFVTAGGLIGQWGADASADLTSNNVTLLAGSAIQNSEMAVTTVVSAAVTGAGNLYLTDIAGGLTVNSATTNGGHIVLDAQGGALTVNSAVAGGSSQIDLSSTGNVLLGSVVAAGDTIMVNAGDSILESGTDAGADLTAGHMQLSAARGIGSTANALEVDTSTAYAWVTGNGLVNLVDVAGGLEVWGLSTANGAATLQAQGGNLIVGSTSVAGNLSLSTSSSGDVSVNDVQASGTLTVNSVASITEVGADPSADLTAPNLVLNAALDIAGTVEIAADNLALTAYSASVQDVNGALTVSSANVTGSLYLETNGGLLTVTQASAVEAYLYNSNGDLAVGNVNGTNYLSAAAQGNILEAGNDTAADLTGNLIELWSLGSIGAANTLELNASNLTVQATGGLTNVKDTAGGVNILSANAGSLTVNATGGNLTATSVSASGAVNLSTTTSGNILLGVVQGDAIAISSVAGIADSENETGADLAGGSATLTGVTIGTLQVALDNLTASATGASNLTIGSVGSDLQVVSATTANGSIDLAGIGGNLEVTSASAGGTGKNISLSAIGDIGVGDVVASGDSIQIAANGSVYEVGTDAAADLTATSASLSAANLGDSGNALEVALTTLTSLSATGDSFIADTAGGLTVTSAAAGGTNSLSATSGALTVSNASGSTVVLTTVNSGNLTFDLLTGGSVVASSAGNLNEIGTDSAADILATNVSLSAVSGIGSNTNALELDASNASAQVTGAGAIYLTDVAGAITFDASTSDGLITLLATGGDLQTGTVNAGGIGRNVTLTSTAGGVRLGDVQAVGDLVTVTSSSFIAQSTLDAEADATAFNITLTANTGIDADVAGSSASGGGLVRANTLNGDVSVDNIANGDSFFNLTTNTGNITAGQTSYTAVLSTVTTSNGSLAFSNENGGVTALAVTAGGNGDIALSAAGELIVDNVTASGDDVTLSSAYRIYEYGADVAADVTADRVTFASAGGIGIFANLETNVNNLSATAGGRVDLQDTAGGLTLDDVQTAGGPVSIDATGGNLVAHNVDTSGENLTLTASNSVFVDNVHGGAVAITGQTIAQGTSDAGVDLSGTNVTLTSVNGVGPVQVDVTGTLTATASAAGNIDVQDLDGNLAVNASTSSGHITLAAAGGDLLAGTVTAGGSGNISLSAGGNAQLGSVTATGNAVTVNAGAAISDFPSDAGVDITSDNASLTAGSGISGLELQVGAVGTIDLVANTASGDVQFSNLNTVGTTNYRSTSGDGNIQIDHLGTQTSAFFTHSDAGSTTVTAGGNAYAAEMTAGTDITMTVTNQFLVKSMAAGGTITGVSSNNIYEADPDAGLDLVADAVVLTAQNGIGAPGAIEMDANTFEAHSVGSQTMNVLDVDDLTVASITNGGAVNVNAGDLNVMEIVSAGSQTLTSTGNVSLGLVQAVGQTVNVTAAGAISELGDDADVDLNARQATILAGTGIAGLELQVGVGGPTLDLVTNTTVGDIQFSNNAQGVTNYLATTGAGNIDIAHLGAQTSAFFTHALAGDVTVTADGNSYAADMTASGNIDMTVGDQFLVKSMVAGGTVTGVATANNIYEADPDAGADIVANHVALTAVTGIGAPGAIEIQASSFEAHSAGPQTVHVSDLSGGLTVTEVVAGGSVEISALGGDSLTVQSLLAGGAVNLQGQGDVQLDDVQALAQVVTVDSGASISEFGDDPNADITSSAVILHAQTGIYGLEISADQLTAATVTGDIDVSLESAADTHLSLQVNSGNISFTQTGAGQLLADDVAAYTGNVSLVSDGNLLVGYVLAAGSASLTSVTGAIDEVVAEDLAVDLTSQSASLDAALGIGANRVFEMAVGQAGPTLNVAAHAAQGDIVLQNAAPGFVNYFATAEGGNVSINQTGSQGAAWFTNSSGGTNVSSQAHSVVADVQAGGNFSAYSPGELLIKSAVVGGEFYASSDYRIYEADPDAAVDITADSITLTAANGIGLFGAIELDGNFLTATNTNNQTIFLTDVQGGIVVNSATNSDGSITLVAQNGDLTAHSVVAGGSGNVTLQADGHIVLGDVQAELNHVAITSDNSISDDSDASVDILATSVDLTAGTGITGVEMSTGQGAGALGLNFSTATGDLQVTNYAHSQTQYNATSGSGDVDIAHLGNWTAILNLHADGGSTAFSNVGTGGSNTLAFDVTATDDITIDVNNSPGEVILGALTAGGTVSISTPNRIYDYGNDPEVDIKAENVVLYGPNGVGIFGDLELDANHLTVEGSTIGIVDQGDGLTVDSAVTTGTAYIKAWGGDLTVTSATANGDVNLWSDFDVLVDNVNALGTTHVDAVGSILEAGSDAAADISSGAINLLAGTGILGLEVSTPNLTAHTDSGNIEVSNLFAGAATVVAITELGDIDVSNVGNLLVHQVEATGRATLTSYAGQIEESLHDDLETDVTATSATFNAALGIGLDRIMEMAIGEAGPTRDVTAHTVAGNIFLQNTAPGMVNYFVTADAGNIWLAQTGGEGAAWFTHSGGHTSVSNDAHSVVAEATAGGDFTVSSPGELLIKSATITGDFTATSGYRIYEADADVDVDLTADNVTLTAVSGIGLFGAIEIDANTLTANNTGNQAINLTDVAGGLVVDSAVNADGTVSLTALDGDLTAVSVIAGGNAGVNLAAGANVLVGDVQAELNHVEIVAGGAISEDVNPDTGADVLATSVNLTAGTGITGLELSTGEGAGALSLNFDTSSGDIQVVNFAHSQTQYNAHTGDGSVDISHEGNWTAILNLHADGGSATFSNVGTGGSNTLAFDVTAANDITIDVNNSPGEVILGALTAGGTVSINTPNRIYDYGADPEVDITAENVVLYAPNGVGLFGDLELDANHLTVEAGLIGIVDQGDGLTVDSAITGSVAYIKSWGGDLTVQHAEGNEINLWSDHNVNAGSVTASSVINVWADGSILEAGSDANADLVSGYMNLFAGTGIGDLEIDNVYLTATTDTGGINFTNTGETVGIGVLDLTAGAGDITVENHGIIVVAEQVSTGAGNISITNVGSDLLVGTVTTPNDVFLSSTEGAIEETDIQDGGADVVAGSVTMVSATGAGILRPFEMSTQAITANATAGRLDLYNESATDVIVSMQTNSASDISLQQTGAGAVNVLHAQSGSQVLVHNQGDIRADNVIAPIRAVLESTDGSLTELGNDGEIDLTAGITVLNAGSGISGLELGSPDVRATSLEGAIELSNESATASVAQLSADSITFSQTGGGDLGVTSAVANDGSVTLTNQADLLLDNVSAATFAFLTSTEGGIQELGSDTTADLTAQFASLQAATGIGSAGSLELAIGLAGPTFYVSAITQNGDVVFTNEAAGPLNYFAETGVGSIDINATGGQFAAWFTHATDGNINVASDSGAHMADMSAGGDITVYAPGELLYKSAVAGGTMTLTTDNRIYEADTDADVDLVADNLIVNAVNGIGIAYTMHIDADHLTVVNTGGNVIHVTDASGGLTVDDASNSGGAVTIVTQAGDLTVNSLNAQGGNANLYSAGDVVVDEVVSSNSIGFTVAGALREAPDHDAEADIVGHSLWVSAGTGIGADDTLELAIGDFPGSPGVTTSTIVGDIRLANEATSSIFYTATTGEGDIEIDQTGAFSAGFFASTGEGNVALSVANTAYVIASASGDVNVDVTGELLIQSAVAGGTFTGTSEYRIYEADPDAGADITAANVVLSAQGGIGLFGTIELDADTLTATNTGNQAIDLTDVGDGVTVSSVSNADGLINLTAQNGDLRVVDAVAGGSGNITLTATAGQVQIGNVTALGNTVDVAASDAIREVPTDAEADITAETINLSSGWYIDLDVDATTVNSSSVSVTDLTDTDGGVLYNVTGPDVVLRGQNGDLVLGNVVNAQAGGNVNVHQTGTGDVVVQNLAVNNQVIITAEGAITGSGLSASNVDLQAGGDVALAATLGAASGQQAVNVDSSAGNIDLDVTALGDLNFQLSTVDGSIQADQTGGHDARWFAYSSAAQDIRLTNDGDALVHQVQSNGGNVDLTAGGSMTIDEGYAFNGTFSAQAGGSISEVGSESGWDVRADDVNLAAANGITGLELDADRLTASNSTSGDIDLTNSLSVELQVLSAVNDGGDIHLHQDSGTLQVDFASADNVSLTSGNGVLIGEVNGQGTVYVGAGSGSAIGATVADPEVDIRAININLNAGAGITGLELATQAPGGGNSVTAHTNGGSIQLENAAEGDTYYDLVSNYGNIDVAQTGPRTAIASASAPNGSIDFAVEGQALIELFTAGQDIAITSTASNIGVNLVEAGGSVDLVAATNIGEFNGQDAAADVVAGGDSTIQALGGAIGLHHALGVDITNGTLSVLATTEYQGLSIAIDGIVSPSNTLLLLNTPPGQVLFNGVPVP